MSGRASTGIELLKKRFGAQVREQLLALPETELAALVGALLSCLRSIQAR